MGVMPLKLMDKSIVKVEDSATSVTICQLFNLDFNPRKEDFFKIAIDIQLTIFWLLSKSLKKIEFKDLESWHAIKNFLKHELNDDIHNKILEFISNNKKFKTYNGLESYTLNFSNFISTLDRHYRKNSGDSNAEVRIKVISSFSDREINEMQQILFNIVQDALKSPYIIYLKSFSPVLLWSIPKSSNTSAADLENKESSSLSNIIKQKTFDICCRKRRKLKVD